MANEVEELEQTVAELREALKVEGQSAHPDVKAAAGEIVGCLRGMWESPKHNLRDVTSMMRRIIEKHCRVTELYSENERLKKAISQLFIKFMETQPSETSIPMPSYFTPLIDAIVGKVDHNNLVNVREVLEKAGINDPTT